MRAPGVLPVTSPNPGEKIGLLYGVKPDSKEEWWIGAALWKIGYSFEFQEQVGGRMRQLGTTVIDFLVHTLPKNTPLFYDGPYFHGKAQAREQDFMLRAVLWQRTKDWWNKPIAIPSDEYPYQIGSYEDAEGALLKIFGPGPNA